jgi:hypothetical protein
VYVFEAAMGMEPNTTVQSLYDAGIAPISGSPQTDVNHQAFDVDISPDLY